MKRKRIACLIMALIIATSTLVLPASAATYSAMIVQGNTPDVGDCKVVFEELKNVPNGNAYSISNRGWHYNNGNSYHNYDKWKLGYSSDPEYALASAQNLIDAGTHDVLYWSGHGGRNPSRLNVHPSSNDYGPGSSQQPTIYIADTLQVDGSDWATSSLWNKNSNLKVAIFSACQVLDNTYNDCKYLVRAMKASNLKVIAGYHLTSPTNPTDTQIAENFFYNTENGGVTGGESIRSSWQTANELVGAGSRWAVLCYKDAGNQYYRIPGFPGNSYAEPAADATVYRFWSQYTSSTGGQAMPASEDGALPLEITVANNNARSINESGLTVYRDMYDDNTSDLDESEQRNVADEYIPEEYKNGIEFVGTVSCEAMDPDDGAVPGTDVVIGKTFCYSNHYNGIRLENNFYKVATDANGVYFTIDKWNNIVASSEETTANTEIMSANAAVAQVDIDSATNSELLYVPVSETTYRLCYAVSPEDAPVYYIDCVTGEEVEIFLA